MEFWNLGDFGMMALKMRNPQASTSGSNRWLVSVAWSISHAKQVICECSRWAPTLKRGTKQRPHQEEIWVWVVLSPLSRSVWPRIVHTKCTQYGCYWNHCYPHLFVPHGVPDLQMLPLTLTNTAACRDVRTEEETNISIDWNKERGLHQSSINDNI